MRTLTQADFLTLWETGRSLHPLDQGVLAVQAAFPEVQESIADWPIGRVNRALAELRCAAFGSALRGWTQCKECAEKLEFEVDGRALADGPRTADDAGVEVSGRAYRLPTSRDLAAAAAERDAAAAAQRLMKRCSGMDDAAWSDDEMDAVGEQMLAADPLAEIRLNFDCPNCNTPFEEDLDLATFLWMELEARAKRLLAEVHALARAYGWSQKEILELNPARRAVYLEMVRV